MQATEFLLVTEDGDEIVPQLGQSLAEAMLFTSTLNIPRPLNIARSRPLTDVALDFSALADMASSMVTGLIAYSKAMSMILARLSLILAYAFEPSFGQAYYAWFFAPDSVFQQSLSKVPYHFLFSSLESVLSFVFPIAKKWFLQLSFVKETLYKLSSASEAFPDSSFGQVSLPILRYGVQYSWIAVSTPVAAAIWGFRYYFEHVENADYRYLFIASLALCLYWLLVLGIWYWFVKYTIRASIATLRFSLAVANQLLRRLQWALDTMERNVGRVEGAMFTLLKLARWGLRILSLLVLVVVDKFMDALHETNKLHREGTAEPRADPSALPLTWLVRKVAVWLYVVYLAWVSWNPVWRIIYQVGGWLYTFRVVFGAYWVIQFNLRAIFEIIYLFSSLVSSIVLSILNAIISSITGWLYRFSAVRRAVQPVFATFKTARVMAASFKLSRVWGNRTEQVKAGVADETPLKVEEDYSPYPNEGDYSTHSSEEDYFPHTTRNGVTPGKQRQQRPLIKNITVLPGQYPASEVGEETTSESNALRRSPRLVAKRLNGYSPTYRFS